MLVIVSLICLGVVFLLLGDPALVLLAALFAPFAISYVVSDWVSSRTVWYILPDGCCRCYKHPATEMYTVSRVWENPDILHDVLELVFPSAWRVANVPVCSTCYSRMKLWTRLGRVVPIVAGGGALLLPGILYLLLSRQLNVLTWPLSSTVCLAGVSVVGSFVAWLVVAAGLEAFASPAYFTALGRLRFRNRKYLRDFFALNPSPETPIIQRNVPVRIYALVLVLVGASALLDIVFFLWLGHTDLKLEVVVVWILGKALAAALIWRLLMLDSRLVRVVAFLGLALVLIVLWPTSHYFETDADDVLSIVMLLVVFLHEWLQSRRRK